MSKDYTWKTTEELIDLLITLPLGTSVDFTFDTPEDECDDFEPTGWYGVKITYMFGSNVLHMGKWGGGDIESEEFYDNEDMYSIFNDYCREYGQDYNLCVSNKYNGE